MKKTYFIYFALVISQIVYEDNFEIVIYRLLELVIDPYCLHEINSLVAGTLSASPYYFSLPRISHSTKYNC